MAGRYGRGAGTFFSGLAQGFAGGAEDLGSAFWQGRNIAARHKREEDKEATRKAERRELIDIQKATADAAQQERRVQSILGVLHPSVRGEAWQMAQGGGAGLQAGMQGLIDKGRGLEEEKTEALYAQQRTLAGMRNRGRQADPNIKAYFENHKGQLGWMRRQPGEIQKEITALQKALAEGASADQKGDRERLVSLAARKAASQDSYIVNARVKAQILNRQMPSLDDMYDGVALYMQARGQNPLDDKLFNSTAMYLGYAKYRPEMLKAQAEQKYQGVFGGAGIPLREPK